MPTETPLFDLGGILITDRRFAAGGHSFALRSIRRVRLVARPRLWWLAGGLAAASLGLRYAARSGLHARLDGWLAALCALSAVLLFWATPRYGIVLDTEDGRFTPVTGRDRFLLEGAAKTLQSAIERLGAAAVEIIADPATAGAAGPPMGVQPIRKTV